MLAIVTRVSRASVDIDGATVAQIGRGFLVLVGVTEGDGDADALWLADKIAAMRVFEDDQGKMNLGLAEVNGSILAVSNFTLAADCRKGNRPSFSRAAQPAEANRLYELFVARCRTSVGDVQTGVFRADMQVSSTNDGPVTIPLDSQIRTRPRTG